MRKGWPIKPLKSLCDDFKQDIVDGPFGSELQRKDYIEEGVPVLKIQNIRPFLIELKKMDYVSYTKFDELKRHSYRSGDIVMTKLGSPLGVSAIVEGIADGVIVADLVRIRAQGVNTKYLCYHLNSQRTNDFINSMQKGTTRPRVTLTVVRELPIVVPSPAEQQRIVGILDEAFEGIATAKANAERNLQNARALFESHLNSVFTQRGEGWVNTALGDLCEFVRGPFGGSLKKSIFVADGYAVYEQQHAIYDQFEDVRYFIDEAKFREMKRFELLPNDLIMSCSGTMGRVAIVPTGIKKGIINQALLKLTPTPKISSAFLQLWMESKAFQDALKEYSGGAAIQNVASVKILKEIRIPLPAIREQERVVDKLYDFREETQHLESIYEQKLAALGELKKSLLHQAFSGEL